MNKPAILTGILGALVCGCHTPHGRASEALLDGYKGHVKEVVLRHYSRVSYKGHWVIDTNSLFHITTCRYDRQGHKITDIGHFTEWADSTSCTTEALNDQVVVIYSYNNDRGIVSQRTTRRTWLNDSTLYYEEWNGKQMHGQPQDVSTVKLDRQYRVVQLSSRYANGDSSYSYSTYNGDTMTAHMFANRQDSQPSQTVTLAYDAHGNPLRQLLLPLPGSIVVLSYQYY